MGLKKLVSIFQHKVVSNSNSIDNEGTFKSIIYTKSTKKFFISLQGPLLIDFLSLRCVWLVGNWIADSYTTKNTNQIITLQNGGRI